MSKILIAEDNPVSRELLREILAAGDHEVVEARDGQEALDRLDKEQPDAVLLDINMPVLDGFAAVQRIRSHPHFCKVPVVAVTANAMKDDRQRILAAGFDAYVAKPISAAAVLRELERLL